jgi:endonuclease-3
MYRCVNKITPLLFCQRDNDMIKMSVEEIKEIIRPCGLSPMKSKGIHLSHILIDKHGGKVPQSFEFLEELPAVGHKTAGVVMSQALYCFSRHSYSSFDVPLNLTNGKMVQTEKMLNAFFPKKYGMTYTYKIWYGREYSRAWLGSRKRYYH